MCCENQYFLAYRPTTKDSTMPTTVNSVNSRSIVTLCPITFDDQKASLINGCWFAPVKVEPDYSKDISIGKHMSKLKQEVDQYLIFLPQMCGESDGSDENTINKYYCVGINWTERVVDDNSTSGFYSPQLDVDFFKDWMNIPVEFMNSFKEAG